MFNLFAAPPPGPFVSGVSATSALPSPSSSSSMSKYSKVKHEPGLPSPVSTPPRAHQSMNEERPVDLSRGPPPFFWDQSTVHATVQSAFRPVSGVPPPAHGAPPLPQPPFLLPPGSGAFLPGGLGSVPFALSAPFLTPPPADPAQARNAQRLYEEAIKDLKVEAARRIQQVESGGSYSPPAGGAQLPQFPHALLTQHLLSTFNSEYLRLGLQQAAARQHNLPQPSKLSLSPCSEASLSPKSVMSSTPASADEILRESVKSRSPHSSVSNTHNQGQRFVCDTCKKSYTTQSGLLKHKEHHCNGRSKQYTCQKCQKVYHSLSALKMHIRTHTLPCHCTICGKAFSRMWLLNGHIRTHTGEKPFQCEVCKRAFADRSNLRAHMQTHSEVKRYKCDACSKTFSRMGLLTKHRQGGCPALQGVPLPNGVSTSQPEADLSADLSHEDMSLDVDLEVEEVDAVESSGAASPSGSDCMSMTIKHITE